MDVSTLLIAGAVIVVAPVATTLFVIRLRRVRATRKWARDAAARQPLYPRVAAAAHAAAVRDAVMPELRERIGFEPDHGRVSYLAPDERLRWLIVGDEVTSDEGEPLKMPPPPNIGGEGNPDYQGPHYDSVLGVETRFARYDMLREPIPGTAVHTIGAAAAFGPIPEDGIDNQADGVTDPDKAKGDDGEDSSWSRDSTS